jgi:hypothetical protein
MARIPTVPKERAGVLGRLARLLRSDPGNDLDPSTLSEAADQTREPIRLV